MRDVATIDMKAFHTQRGVYKKEISRFCNQIDRLIEEKGSRTEMEVSKGKLEVWFDKWRTFYDSFDPITGNPPFWDEFSEYKLKLEAQVFATRKSLSEHLQTREGETASDPGAAAPAGAAASAGASRLPTKEEARQEVEEAWNRCKLQLEEIKAWTAVPDGAEIRKALGEYMLKERKYFLAWHKTYKDLIQDTEELEEALGWLTTFKEEEEPILIAANEAMEEDLEEEEVLDPKALYEKDFWTKELEKLIDRIEDALVRKASKATMRQLVVRSKEVLESFNIASRLLMSTLDMAQVEIADDARKTEGKKLSDVVARLQGAIQARDEEASVASSRKAPSRTPSVVLQHNGAAEELRRQLDIQTTARIADVRRQQQVEDERSRRFHENLRKEKELRKQLNDLEVQKTDELAQRKAQQEKLRQALLAGEAEIKRIERRTKPDLQPGHPLFTIPDLDDMDLGEDYETFRDKPVAPDQVVKELQFPLPPPPVQKQPDPPAKIPQSGVHWIQQMVDSGDPVPPDVRKNQKSLLCPKLPIFRGDVTEWANFDGIFMGIVHMADKSSTEKLSLLKMHLEGLPLDMVRHFYVGDAHYIMALKTLHDWYGNRTRQRRIVRKEIREIPEAKEKDPEGLATFAMKAISKLSYFLEDKGADVDDIIGDVNEHLPREVAARMRAKMELAEEMGTPATIASYSNWLRKEAMSYRDFSKELEKTDKKKPAEKPSYQRESASKQDKKPFKLNAAEVTTEQKDNPGSGRKCKVCEKGIHLVEKCFVFKKMDPKARKEVCQEKSICYWCLGTEKDRRFNCPERKNRQRCTEPGCSNPSHHTLLHGAGWADVNPKVMGCARTQESRVSLGMLRVKVPVGDKLVPATAFMDSGCDTTVMSQKFQRKHNIPIGRPETRDLAVVGGATTRIRMAPVDFELVGQDNKRHKLTGAWTMPKLVTMKAVNWAKEKKRYKHLAGLALDPVDEEPDIILGMDNSGLQMPLEVITGEDPEDPYAMKTALGWVILGTIKGSAPPKGIHMHHARTTLSEVVNRFFDGEAFGTEHQTEITLSADDRKAKEVIEQGLVKLEDEPGYQVKLPWKEDTPVLDDNRRQAEKRLQSQLRRLAKDETDRVDYDEAMEKYRKEGYASVIYKYDPEDPKSYLAHQKEAGQYFLPHQGVRKKNGGKLRVVFDASATVHKDGISLNGHLLIGPKLQNAVAAVLLRHREEEVAMTGDIEAMFSRIRLNPEDAKKHRFLWQFPGEKEYTVMQMNRLAFGDGPSPCIAITTVNRTADDYGQGKDAAVETIKNGFYVDDLADSCPTVEEANQRSEEITEILAHGDFNLRKWVSNHSGFKKMEAELHGQEANLLGMIWDTKRDVYRHALPVDLEPNEKLTKRTIASKVASFYSPLGLASPYMVKAKVRLANLHLKGLDWDDDLESDRTKDKFDARALEGEADWWRSWMEELPALCAVEFPRCLRPMSAKIKHSELHIFVDASEEAFAAVVYVRNCYQDGSYHCNLIAAKNKVGPRKAISVAKMELQAALLGARLAARTEKDLRFPVNRRLIWTDSSCVRHWVRSTATFFKPFVSNRVGEIQELTKPEEWRHVPGKLNIADIATRSHLDKEETIIPEAWIKGPKFLYEDEVGWPKDLAFNPIGEEIRTKWEFTAGAAHFADYESEMIPEASIMLAAEVKKVHFLFDPTRYSSLNKLIKRKALFCRLANWKKGLPGPREKELTIDDCQQSLRSLIRQAQQEDFGNEVSCLSEGKPILKQSRLLKLTPFMGEQGLIRARGRLGKSLLPYNTKHPILLAPENPLTKLIVEDVHHRHNHPGVDHMVTLIREKYWILKGREMVKKSNRNCLKCLRQSVQPLAPLMADMPAERVMPFPAFYHTSVDFFGPLYVLSGRNIIEKKYGTLFACMTTRAVHIEVAASLSTPDFLVVLRTFENMRGTPKYLYSDNGSNFIGAEPRVQLTMERINADPRFKDQMVQRGIHWKFQPSRAPHFGGLHEALVKSAKHAMLKAVDQAERRRHLREGELRSLFAEVTNYLNSRPLTYQSGDPKDGLALTPNHFLLQRPSGEIHPGMYQAGKYGDNYEFVQSVANDVWRIWETEYLPTLMKRNKWEQRTRNLQVGDVVLVLEDNLPRNKWVMGWIEKTYPGNNDCIRVVDIRTPTTTMNRPAVRCCLLEEASKALEENQRLTHPVHEEGKERGPSKGEAHFLKYQLGKRAALVATPRATPPLRKTTPKTKEPKPMTADQPPEVDNGAPRRSRRERRAPNRYQGGPAKSR